ncbi:hypothetical protein CDL12_15284 [Handroanthus impetiginosus]|uniref:Jacalin-type lectin domain-containing protein n=1 Tax=Handroanthus impetiginosus TaxID=429701 RepID=A0A2G9H3L4_9LAMI|nr:hypothetical protein CDL12_15284 [Handroanthus impetiginosus]
MWRRNKKGEQKAIVVGPWGGHRGTNWDDRSYDGVREITLMHARCINSIRVAYDKNGKPITAKKHGGVGGVKIAEIKLQFPDEFLTTVTGHYFPMVHGGSQVTRSLTFKGNWSPFGPFGVEEGTLFFFPTEGGQIIGFKGRGGWYLDAIGFHIAKIETPKVEQKAPQRFNRGFASTISFAAPRDKSTKSPA